MKAIIVYDTKHGTSKLVAERVAEAIKGKGGQAELLNLRTQDAPELGAYDAIAIGGPFYMGQWSKRARSFASANSAVLAGKAIGLFSVGTNPELDDATARASLPASVAAAVSASAHVGGRIQFKKLCRLEQFIVKKVTGKAEDSSTLDLDAADALGATLAAQA